VTNAKDFKCSELSDADDPTRQGTGFCYILKIQRESLRGISGLYDVNAWTKETLENINLDARDKVVLVAEMGGMLVGSIRFWVVAGRRVIRLLSVKPGYQGRASGRPYAGNRAPGQRRAQALRLHHAPDFPEHHPFLEPRLPSRPFSPTTTITHSSASPTPEARLLTAFLTFSSD